MNSTKAYPVLSSLAATSCGPSSNLPSYLVTVTVGSFKLSLNESISIGMFCSSYFNSQSKYATCICSISTAMFVLFLASTAEPIRFPLIRKLYVTIVRINNIIIVIISASNVIPNSFFPSIFSSLFFISLFFHLFPL